MLPTHFVFNQTSPASSRVTLRQLACVDWCALSAGRRMPCKPGTTSWCSSVPPSRQQVAVHPPAHRWAALTVGTACSTGCHVPLARSSPPPDSACLHHAPCNEVCRRLQLPWYSPPADSVGRHHAQYSEACHRLKLPWHSPPADSVGRHHAPCSEACLHLQLPSNSPPTGSVCPRRAPRSGPCRL